MTNEARTEDGVDIQQAARRDALQAVLDHGKTVWVVFGVYHDRSGSKILEVYTDQWQAQDRVDMLREGGSVCSVDYAKIPINKTFGVDLNP